MKREIVVFVAPMFVLGLAACRTHDYKSTETTEPVGVTRDSAVSPEETVASSDGTRRVPMPVTRNTAVSPEETVREDQIIEEVAVTDDYGDEDMTVTDDVVVDELGDEGAIADVGAGKARDTTANVGAAAGRAGECGLKVEAKSAGAVGDPCLTTAEFMRSMGLSDREISRVEAAGELP